MIAVLQIRELINSLNAVTFILTKPIAKFKSIVPLFITLVELRSVILNMFVFVPYALHEASLAFENC